MCVRYVSRLGQPQRLRIDPGRGGRAALSAPALARRSRNTAPCGGFPARVGTLPGLYLRLVPQALLVVAIIAKGLQVAAVKKTLFPADRPGLYVVHTGSGAYYAPALALCAKGLLYTDSPR